MSRMDFYKVLALMAIENSHDSQEHDISDMTGQSDDDCSGTFYDQYAYDNDDDDWEF